ncbi:Hypothetical protein, precursor (plasmid) [Deinococcus deserti VCD115]|uniref:Uncharacterized protein n=2 Tax=Deinococcus TaxID=1298 RepID=C1D360_DEIDV|nr:Hypothetical protein, precursor [Deinococcus deserti VCD115]
MKKALSLLSVLLWSAVYAQPGPTTASTITRLSLTPGAVRVTDAAATREFGQVLNTLAKGQNGGCQTSEYLVWANPDLAERISADLTAQFKARGLTFKSLDESEDEESASISFLLSDKTNRYVGLLYGDAESVVLGWCQLKAPAPVAAPKPAVPASTSRTPWPAFGTFKAGDVVQVLTSVGWKRKVIVTVGPQPGQGGNFEKQYVVNDPGVTTWNDFYDWGWVAHTERQPYWTGFFIGDWKVGEAMAINTRTDGTSAWNEVAYASASDTLRINGDGTYEWKDMNGKVTKGKWTAAPDGPGVVVKDAKGGAWTLRNNTNLVEERIRKLEGARLYPSDRSQMSMAASRPLTR